MVVHYNHHKTIQHDLPQPTTLTVQPQITKLKRLQDHRSCMRRNTVQNHAAAFDTQYMHVHLQRDPVLFHVWVLLTLVLVCPSQCSSVCYSVRSPCVGPSTVRPSALSLLFSLNSAVTRSWGSGVECGGGVGVECWAYVVFASNGVSVSVYLACLTRHVVACVRSVEFERYVGFRI